MTVNLEVKGTLAKLLATEDIVVEHREVETAQFDVENRVLTLPIWDASNYVFDMLVGHEVSHALFTPNEDWTEKCKAPQQFVNVCEDVRVEKLMKDKYLGIAKTFYRGYSELHAKDFFEVGDQDVNSFNLADKINLHAKIGAFLGVKFTPQEQEIVNVVENAKTFEDTLAAAEALYNFCKANQPTDQDQEGTEGVQLPLGGLEDSGDSTDNSSGSDESPVSRSGSSDDVEGGSDSDSSDTGMDDNGSPLDEDDAPSLDVETAKSLGGNLKKIAQKPVRNNTYIEKPHIIPDEIIVRNEEISDFCEEFWNRIYSEPLNKKTYTQPIDEELLKIKKEAEKEVNYLVKEFECRKSADAYSRAATSRTGVLDTKKLHTYKFNEDLFKKITVLPEGKNHGLIFVLDWSGSMHFVINDTVKQLLNLLWFCKKVNIPFEVYGFTNDSPSEWRYASREGRGGMEEIQVMKENEIYCHPTFRLLNFVSSDSGKDFEEQCQHLFKLSYSLQNGYSDYVPYGFNLSGTPLNETIIALRELIPDFFKKHQVSKLNTVLLTDGESQSISRVNKVQSYYNPDEMEFGRISLHSRCQLRDRKIGRVYHACNEWNWKNSITQTLLQNLEDNFPNCNIIGIRLLQSGEVSRFHYQYKEDENYTDQDKKSWSKTKSAILKPTGYSVLYGIASSRLNESEEFEVKELSLIHI